MAYTDKQKEDAFNKIIELIEGGMPLRKILSDSDKPCNDTFYKWVDEDEEKAERYVRACEARADGIFEDILEIADGKDSKTVINDQGIHELSNDDVNRNKLQVEARKWVLGKMNPKKYGDHSKLTVEGGDKPIQIDFTE